MSICVLAMRGRMMTKDLCYRNPKKFGMQLVCICILLENARSSSFMPHRYVVLWPRFDNIAQHIEQPILKAKQDLSTRFLATFFNNFESLFVLHLFKKRLDPIVGQVGLGPVTKLTAHFGSGPLGLFLSS
uniref:Uncharacterized protein n=1 Tax=Cucumis melo TaxID=3656 RepID=A0A9I9EB91_CUCME